MSTLLHRYLALYKGLVPKIMRLGPGKETFRFLFFFYYLSCFYINSEPGAALLCLVPGGAVMLLVYEYVSGWLQRNW